MYAKIIALFALIAVALAAPKPEPAPQAVVYSGVDYASPYAFGASPYAFGAYPPVLPYAAAPALPYSAYTNSYFLKK